MTLELQETDGRRLYVAKEGHGVLGYIAIDSMIDGRARGGLRMLPDVSADEIRDAARAMTLKYGFLGLPQGGAKAGVRGDPEAEAREKQAQLVRFAKVAQPLLTERVYIPDTDLGTRTEDIQAMMRSVGARPGRRHWRTTRSGYYTALSCLISAEAALAHRHACLLYTSDAADDAMNV